ncbi:hypothetical protein [Rhizocola hellebori]|uniref:hypothetical protein n=1 Tax=Rhizocola hellebori TaxID=1392758 RepID=UPI00194156AA|nr:hypothetical protein [Rhizocola hellebori]
MSAFLLTAADVGLMPISPGLGALFVPGFAGAPATAKPFGSFSVPQHPHLAPDGSNSMHNDAYATDSYRGPGPLGHRPRVNSATYGVSECATLAFDRAGRLVGLCGGITGPRLKLIDPGSLRVLASQELPGRVLRAGVSPLEDLCGGAYFYLDEAGRAVVATTNRQIHVIEVSTSDMSLLHVYDLAYLVPQNDCLIALLPDWSGRIWFETSGGMVGAIDPSGAPGAAISLPGEAIANSFAVDETGGVFVVTDHALYRLEADAAGAPRITWRQAYDRGSRRKPGQLSHGSGTTPTLIGPDRVAITDNAEPRMNVLVYDRITGRPICGAPVFAPGASATDNSLVAVGNSLFVENNYGYTGPASTMFGSHSAPGVARVDVQGERCETVWTSQEVAPSSVPKASQATGLLYLYGKPPYGVVAAWTLTAIDMHTGKTAFRVLTGTGMPWNNHYSAIALGPNGCAYAATLTGLVRICDTA